MNGVPAIARDMAEAAARSEISEAVARCPATIRALRADRALAHLLALALLGDASAVDARAILASAIAGHAPRLPAAPPPGA